MVHVHLWDSQELARLFWRHEGRHPDFGYHFQKREEGGSLQWYTALDAVHSSRGVRGIRPSRANLHRGPCANSITKFHPHRNVEGQGQRRPREGSHARFLLRDILPALHTSPDVTHHTIASDGTRGLFLGFDSCESQRPL